MLISPTSRGRATDQILNTLGEDASRLEEGLTALEQDFQLVGGVVADILAVDREGRPVTILAGAKEEDLMVKALHVRHGWSSVSHLLRRVFDRSGVQIEKGLRIVLLAPRFTDAFRETVKTLPGGPLEVREFQFAQAEGRRFPILIDPDQGSTIDHGIQSVGSATTRTASIDPRPIEAAPIEAAPPPAPHSPPAAVDVHESRSPEGSGQHRAPIVETFRAQPPSAPSKALAESTIEPGGGSTDRIPRETAVIASPHSPSQVNGAKSNGTMEVAETSDGALDGLFDEARCKIMRIDTGIHEDAAEDTAVYTVAGQRLATLERRQSGLVGRLGNDPTETLVGDHQKLNSFLNSAFRFYFRLCTPVTDESES